MNRLVHMVPSRGDGLRAALGEARRRSSRKKEDQSGIGILSPEFPEFFAMAGRLGV